MNVFTKIPINLSNSIVFLFSIPCNCCWVFCFFFLFLFFNKKEESDVMIVALAQIVGQSNEKFKIIIIGVYLT